MAFELRQNLKLAQKLVMTPQLRQAIRLLQIGRLELREALREEMEQNPMLEEVSPTLDDDGGPESLSATEEAPDTEAPVTTALSETNGMGEIDWNDYSNNFDADFSFAHEKPPADAPSQFDFLSISPGLGEHLARQLAPLRLDEQDGRITKFICGSLDRHGYLSANISDICAACDCTPEAAQACIRIVQSLDPPGVAACNLQECLLLQLEREDREDEHAERIIKNYMHLLEKRNYLLLARELKISQQRVLDAVAHIRTLNPYPGNDFDNEPINYATPDVYVFKVDGEFVIQLNDEGLPNLRLSEEYLRLLKEKQGLSAQSRSWLMENKRNAEWIIKSVDQRQRAIYKVMESLLKFQRDFFEKGPLYMKPLVLRDVADDIGMHESTVSRATANKYVHTPEGIYELKFFFNSAISSGEGDKGAEAIKTRIRQLVNAEDPAHPLSDNLIAELLAKEDIQVARRTVAKYREQMKILPVKHRRLLASETKNA